MNISNQAQQLMSIKVLSAGLQTSVQDNGRFGSMHLGISRSGAMDSLAYRLSNYLVANPLHAPALEITLVGPCLAFECDTVIAICGANFSPSINNLGIQQSRPYCVKKGDILHLSGCRTGARAYIAIQGNWQLPQLLGSASTHTIADYGGQIINDGERITIQPKLDSRLPVSSPQSIYQPCYTGNYVLRIVDSVETQLFTQQQQQHFAQQSLKVSVKSNRMGIRLSHSEVNATHIHSILSSGLAPGSIQMTTDGTTIITGPDGQTTGGYPRIANVIRADHDLLAQLRSHDTLTFQWLTTEQTTVINEQRQQLENQLLSL